MRGFTCILFCLTALIGSSQGKALLKVFPTSSSESCNGRAVILEIQHCGRQELSLNWNLLPEQILSEDSVVGLCHGYQSICIYDEWGRDAIIDFELDYDEEVQIIDLTWYCLDSMTYMGDIELISSVVHADTRDTLAAIDVEILRNGRFFTKLISPLTGSFSTLLPVGYNYDVFYRKEGYYTKSLQIDARSASIIDVGSGYATAPHVNMIPVREYLDMSVLKHPIGIMSYVQNSRTFEYNIAYTQQIKDLLELLLEPAND